MAEFLLLLGPVWESEKLFEGIAEFIHYFVLDAATYRKGECLVVDDCVTV